MNGVRTGWLRGAAVALTSVMVVGCGATRLQTARTVPPGETRTTVAASLVYNSLVQERGFNPAHLPLELMVRRGVTPQVDWGLRLFFAFGLLGDVKWNLLPPDSRTALAVSTGLGFAADPVDDRYAQIVHLPLSVTVSHDLASWFTPYAAISYGNYWIFNYSQRSSPDPGQRLADRSWSGDAVRGVHLGVELSRASGRALLLEYVYSQPGGLNDPGDGYTFIPNHLVSIGFHTGRTPARRRNSDLD